MSLDFSLDFKKKTIKHWSSRLARHMEGEIPYKDIFSRLQLMHLSLDSDSALRDAAAQCNDEEDMDASDLQSREVISVKMSPPDAIAAFN